MDSEEDYCSGGDDCDYDPAEDIVENNEEPYTKSLYTLLKEDAIKQLQQKYISEVSSVLAVSRGTSCSLLLRKNWCVSSVFEDWFAMPKPNSKQTTKKEEGEIYCKICMESVSISRMLSTGLCGHLFCSDCWTSYVAVSIDEGPRCLTLCCPEPKCAAAVDLDMVEAMAAADDVHKRKLDEYIYRSYVESSKNRKWCPGPGCDRAVEMVGAAEETYDVACDCGHKFCWRCTEEQHRPVGCDTVAKWAEKNSSEAENNTWILAYTKACPSCHKKIEKNQGCNHMTCTCGFEFCWLCLTKDKGGAHVCNTYRREEGEAEQSRMEATRQELKRYAHYHERWASNHKSREIALADAVRVRDKHLVKLSMAHGMPETALQFVMEAWDQIVECRRVLKWSYTYGYYISKEEGAKKTFFEYLQGQAEAALERLHHCAEKEMIKFIQPQDGPSENFGDFRRKLTDVTCVTRKYFQNLVRALENDLSEVDGFAVEGAAAKVHDDDKDVELINMLIWTSDYA